MSALASSDALGSSVSASSEPTAKGKVLHACEVSLSFMKELNEWMKNIRQSRHAFLQSKSCK